MSKKLEHKFVEKAYLNADIKLLNVYQAINVENNLECLKCGYLWESKYYDFRYRNLVCPKCDGKLKPTQESVKNDYLNNEIKLLSIYQNVVYKNSLECLKCGYLWKAQYSNFQHRKDGCIKCWKLSNRGENHPSWNPNLTDSERLHRDYYHRKESIEWRKAVYDRDKAICQCCGYSKGGSLNAHHIDSWKEHKDDRFNIDNGVTLCETCHKAYHKACHKKWENEVNHNTFYLWMAEQSKIEPSKWSWVICYPESMKVWLEYFKI